MTTFRGRLNDLIASPGNEFRELLSIRNNSILAHGFAPVEHASWNRMQQWARDQFLPVLHHYAKDARVKESIPPATDRSTVTNHVLTRIHPPLARSTIPAL